MNSKRRRSPSHEELIESNSTTITQKSSQRMLKKALKRLKRGDVTSKDMEALTKASECDVDIAKLLLRSGKIELQLKKNKEPISTKQFRSFVQSAVSGSSSSPNWIVLKNGTLINSVTILCVDVPLPYKKVMNEGDFAKGRRVLHIDCRVSKENQSVRNLIEGLIMYPVEAKIPSPASLAESPDLTSELKKKRTDDDITEEELTKREDHATLQRWAHPIDVLQENEYPLPGSSLPEGYVRTRPRSDDDDGDDDMVQPVVAIDCEMCRTKNGLELTRVTALDYYGKVLLDELVMPDSPIVDYVTKYSGITKEMMEGVNTRLSDVRERIMKFVKRDYTVLIGHSLECDLNALRLCHLKVVDSAVLYPHRQGRPYKNKLRYLTKMYLDRDIQCHDNGHDSGEDARAALDLVRLKLSKGASFGIPSGAKALKSMFSTLDTTNLVRCFCVSNVKEEKVGKHIVPEDFVTSQPCMLVCLRELSRETQSSITQTQVRTI